MTFFSTVNEVLLDTTFHNHPLIGLIVLIYLLIGKLSVPGRPAYLDNSRTGALSRCDGLFGRERLIWTFFCRLPHLSFFSLSLRDGPI